MSASGSLEVLDFGGSSGGGNDFMGLGEPECWEGSDECWHDLVDLNVYLQFVGGSGGFHGFVGVSTANIGMTWLIWMSWVWE